MKLGMELYVLKLYKVYITDDPELTLTHFKTMSNFAKLVFVLTVAPDNRCAFTGPLPLVALHFGKQLLFSCRIGAIRNANAVNEQRLLRAFSIACLMRFVTNEF